MTRRHLHLVSTAEDRPDVDDLIGRLAAVGLVVTVSEDGCRINAGPFDDLDQLEGHAVAHGLIPQPLEVV